MGAFFARIMGWLKTPFTTPLDPGSLFLLVGVIIVSIIVWNMVLYHIRIAATEIA